MSIQGIYDAVTAGVFRRPLEGESFIAVAPTKELARQVGPLLAQAIRPARVWGGVLHVEQIDVQRWEVVVEDRGPRVAGKAF